MEIKVEGNAKRFYKPNFVTITLNFYTKRDNYELALKDGVKDVECFLNVLTQNMNFKKEDLKTRSFNVYEETRYDYEKKEQIKLGFAYTQVATLKFDYDINIMSSFMELVVNLKNPPKYTINFGIKEEEKIKNEILGEAYNKAKEKAEAIAIASGKKIKDCIKTSFTSFDSNFLSESRITENACFMKKGMINGDKSVSNIINNVFTPQDIEVRETLYCLFVAE